MLPLLAAAITAADPGPFEPNISHAPNLNGQYPLSQTPGGVPGLFPASYSKYPGGVEHFDVYSPEISSLYSQVFWKGLDPVDLFDNIRENKLKLPPPRTLID